MYSILCELGFMNAMYEFVICRMIEYEQQEVLHVNDST